MVLLVLFLLMVGVPFADRVVGRQVVLDASAQQRVHDLNVACQEDLWYHICFEMIIHS